jgi:hypothetical protein
MAKFSVFAVGGMEISRSVSVLEDAHNGGVGMIWSRPEEDDGTINLDDEIFKEVRK